MSGTKQWWETFFTGIGLDAQRVLKDQDQTRREIDFVQELLEVPRGSEILDAPCGVGRHSVELAGRGYRVVGVDLAEPLIEDAITAAADRGVEVEWERRDMRDLPWPGRFDAAVCMWGSFGYFDDEGNRDYLCSVHDALKPGGRFLMDTHTTETLMPRIQEPRAWRRAGNILLLEERVFDHEKSCTVTDWLMIRNDEIGRERTNIRLYTYRELAGLFSEAGFRIDRALGSLDGEPFALGASRLHIAATRI